MALTAKQILDLNRMNRAAQNVQLGTMLDELEVADMSLLTATAGVATASKAAILGTTKNLDTLVIADGGFKLGAGAGTAVTKTAAQINTLVVGTAGGFMVSRSAAPVALDGGNPTSVAHGLTTCVSATVQLVGSAAPGLGTSVLTCVINGANLDIYAWKVTGVGDTTLIASTGTEEFNWVAVGV